MLSTAQLTCFLIADISGYTSYLAGVELDHAQDILADLTGTGQPGQAPHVPECPTRSISIVKTSRGLRRS